MADREKVIKGLEHCKIGDCVECPYDQIRKNSLHGKHDKWKLVCNEQLTEDILSLLRVEELPKEQEAVEPIKIQRMDDNFSFFVPYYLCGNCRYELVGKDAMFCSHCGQEVKWE